MKIFRISEKAIDDIEDTWLNTKKHWSTKQADRYYNLIFDEINYVTQNYESGKSMDHVKMGYRAAKVKSHLVFYKKIDEDTIEVIRILHQSMDIENHL